MEKRIKNGQSFRVRLGITKPHSERNIIMPKSNKEQLIENIQNTPSERVKAHLIELIKDLTEECQIKAGMDNGYIDNDKGVPILDFYIENFMFTNFNVSD